MEPFNMTVETVSIKTEDGRRVRINRSDYDPETHQLWETETKDGAPIDPENPPANPNHLEPGPVGGDTVNREELRVAKENKKWFVVDKDGSKVEGFDKEGYKSDADAWLAIWPQAKPQPDIPG